jgi:hypothetical protein
MPKPSEKKAADLIRESERLAEFTKELHRTSAETRQNAESIQAELEKSKRRELDRALTGSKPV